MEFLTQGFIPFGLSLSKPFDKLRANGRRAQGEREEAPGRTERALGRTGRGLRVTGKVTPYIAL